MEASYSSRKAATASGCSSMNSVRATTAVMMSWLPDFISSQAWVTSMAWRIWPSPWMMAAVAAGTGSMAASMVPLFSPG